MRPILSIMYVLSGTRMGPFKKPLKTCGKLNKLLLQKVEELTLYVIDLQKQINELKSSR